MAVQQNGDSDVSVVNVPSEGTQRAVANGIGIKATGAAGVPNMITAQIADSDDNIMFEGFNASVSAKVYDGQLNAMNVSSSSLTYSCSLAGSWNGNVFTPTETGNGTITVSYGGVSTTIDVVSMKGIAGLSAEAGRYGLGIGETTTLTATALNQEGYSLSVSQDDVVWTVDNPAVGHIEGNKFTADAEGVCGVTATLPAYGVSGTLKIAVGKKYVAINSFEGSRNIVNYYYPSDGTGVSGGGYIDGTESYDGSSSLRIDYSFTADTVTTQCVYASLENNEILFPAGVSEFEIWYKGDGSGNALKAVINYGSGQTADVTIDGNMESTSWQKATVELPADATSNIRINKLYVASYGTDGKAVKGSVYVDYILAQAVTSSEGGSASTGSTDYMAADLDNITGSYTSMSVSVPTTNIYTINNNDAFTVLTLGVTSGSLTTNNSNQWSYIQEILSTTTRKNVIIELSVNPWSGITDIKERAAFHDILKTGVRKYGKNVIVIYPGTKNAVEIKDGIRYMSISSPVKFKGNSENLYYEF
jgi:hypothetical protein